ncbi:MAG: hypothetical protein GXO38_06610 [Epsilonproteobacteria bacterium]|nr:hypothetical protein [Campylobacterota bacterium]
MKILLLSLIVAALHDYFIAQCDVLHPTQKCDIIAQHVEHKLYHQYFLLDTPLTLAPHFLRLPAIEGGPTLLPQTEPEVATPPPRG